MRHSRSFGIHAGIGAMLLLGALAAARPEGTCYKPTFSCTSRGGSLTQCEEPWTQGSPGTTGLLWIVRKKTC